MAIEHRLALVAGTGLAEGRGDSENAMTKLDAAHRNALDAKQYAFAKQRKEPLENASHVRNALARFNQVEGVTDAERDEAWKHIKSAAKD